MYISIIQDQQQKVETKVGYLQLFPIFLIYW